MRTVGLPLVIILVSTTAAADGAADASPRRGREATISPVVIEASSPEVPRADCGSVVELPGGKLLVAYMKYAPNQKGATDFGWCNIWSRTSQDNGRTWIEPRLLVDVAPGDLNVQAPALLRLPSGELLMICLRAHPGGASSTMCLFRSRDKGRSFQEEPPIWQRSKGDHFGARTPLTAAISADGGLTWRLVGDLAADPDASYSDLGCTFTASGDAIITYRYGKPAWQNLSLHAMIVARPHFSP